MREPIIAIDIDGMFASFIDGALTKWATLTGVRYEHDAVDDYMIERALKLTPDETKRFIEMVHAPGFCSSIPAYPNARMAVTELRALGRVYAVTSPTASATWARERELWLEHNLAFDRKSIVSTGAKHLVYADVFCEDTFTMLRTWKHFWRDRGHDGAAILLTRRYNAHEDVTGIAARVDSLEALVLAATAAVANMQARGDFNERST